jgi:hypothetical protein
MAKGWLVAAMCLISMYPVSMLTAAAEHSGVATAERVQAGLGVALIQDGAWFSVPVNMRLDGHRIRLEPQISYASSHSTLSEGDYRYDSKTRYSDYGIGLYSLQRLDSALDLVTGLRLRRLQETDHSWTDFSSSGTLYRSSVRADSNGTGIALLMGMDYSVLSQFTVAAEVGLERIGSTSVYHDAGALYREHTLKISTIANLVARYYF